jgi:predicted DNA-binding transcriptional regulator AlpA
VRRDYLSPDRIGYTSPSSCTATTRHPVAQALRQPRRAPRVLVSRPQRLYFNYAARLGASACRVAHRRLLRLHRVSGCLGTSRGSSSTTQPTRRGLMLRHIAQLIVDYFAYAARPGASACRAAHSRLLLLHCASQCVGTSRDSPSTTSSTPRVRVPRHVARIVVDYFASRGSLSTTSLTPRVRVPRHVSRLVARLIVDYFAYVARPGASARRVAHRVARCRLLHLRRASSALARRVAHLAAHRRLLRLRRTSGFLGMSRGSSRGSSSTTPCAATSSCGHTVSTSATPCVATTCLAVTLALLQVHSAPLRRRLLVASR